MSLTLTGCAILPTNGPTARQIIHNIPERESGLKIELVNINAKTDEVQTGFESPQSNPHFDLPAVAPEQRNFELIAPGDKLQVAIFEVGVALFGGQASFGGDAATTATGPQIPGVQVDAEGTIALPYVGRMKVAGMTTDQAQKLVQQRLAPYSQNPQIVISVLDSLRNSVQIFGKITTPGRVRLMPGGDHLLNVIAAAGGATESSIDTVVRVTRDEVSSQLYLSAIEAGSPADLRLVPGDTIELINEPISYSVFGATSKVSQVPFGARKVSLAEAIARVGGPNDAQADASAVFIFRYDRGEQAGQLTPVIYRLNLLRPESYFLAQRFAMKDKDLIYFSNSAANPPTKMLTIINQLFSPILTARVLTK